MTRTVHQLKVTLHQVRPPVWRRIVLESDLTLVCAGAGGGNQAIRSPGSPTEW